MIGKHKLSNQLRQGMWASARVGTPCPKGMPKEYHDELRMTVCIADEMLADMVRDLEDELDEIRHTRQ